ncbi:MAG: hypothetical protein LAP21_03990 [Acidobacteriia bacterium]|nr:hypothetical protein [Terriglobia bacterium]
MAPIFTIIDRLLSTPFSRESLERDFSVHLEQESTRWTDAKGTDLFSRVQLIDVPSSQRAIFELQAPLMIPRSEVDGKYDLDPGNIIQMIPEVDKIIYRIAYPGQELFLTLTGSCLSGFAIGRPPEIHARRRASAEDGAPIGTVTMQPDRTLVAQLRAEGPNGIVGDAQYVLAPPNPAYQRMIDHVGGLEPGETKPVKPWS